MSPTTKTSRFLLLSSMFLTLPACGVLFPETEPPTVLTKTLMTERPILLDATCPPPPSPPAKPAKHNTLSKDAAEYFATLDSWAMACRDLNEAIESILRPSKEALRPTMGEK